LETTKNNEIITIASICKKELKFDAIPTYEQSEKVKMEGYDRFTLSSHAPGPAYHIHIPIAGYDNNSTKNIFKNISGIRRRMVRIFGKIF
jgi:hypothetical protein